MFQEHYQLMGLRNIRTTQLRPQSDGPIERFNWTILNELAKFT